MAAPARLLLAVIISLLFWPGSSADALGSSQNPQAGSIGFEATISGSPPSQAASIAVPGGGQVFNSSPITVSGLCPNNLLIKVYDNNIFVGSTVCQNGSYSLQVSLFNGSNSLAAIDYDALNQAGPSSNSVNITFKSATFIPVGSQLFVTSNYGQKGANPGQELDWPITIVGGNSPYALSVDWGDGQGSLLQSVATSGDVIIKHSYKTAGTYNITVKATDASGQNAFLQLVGVANGQTANQTNGSKNAAKAIKKEVIWWPALLILPFTIAAFWLGQRHQSHLINNQYQD